MGEDRTQEDCDFEESTVLPKLSAQEEEQMLSICWEREGEITSLGWDTEFELPTDYSCAEASKLLEIEVQTWGGGQC